MAEGAISVPASRAADAWALGALLYEIFAGAPLFGPALPDASVVACLLNRAPLPPDARPGGWGAVADVRARVLVQGLLQHDARARTSVRTAAQSPVLNAGG